MQTTNILREDIERIDEHVKLVSGGRSHITAKKERELFDKYTNGTKREKKEALDLLVAYNIVVIADIALKVINNMKGGEKIDPLDLIQVGTLTFLKKLPKWDPAKENKMLTYYYRDVKTLMQRFIMNNAFQVRQGSVYLQHLAHKISKVRQEYAKTNRKPTNKELAEKLNTSENTIMHCLRVTTLQTVTIENNWILFKEQQHNDIMHIAPVYYILLDLLYNIDPNISDYFLFEIIDFLEKKKTPSIKTLNLLKKRYKEIIC